MRNSFAFGTRIYSLAAAFTLSASLLSCTEIKENPVPTPAPKPPTTQLGVNEVEKDYSAYTNLVWSDEFDGSSLDKTKWGFDLGNDGWGNNELQNYTNLSSNVFLQDGNLVIRAVRQDGGYTSGRIKTQGKQDFQYGRIDIRAKLPKGQGVWPAIWMLGSNIDKVNWPACGEIDIMELRGRLPNQMLSTMHYGASTATHEYKNGPTQVLASGTFADDYHIFSVVRSKNQIKVFLDGNAFYTFTSGSTSADGMPYPFNDPFFVILNVAIGGNFDGGRAPEANAIFPQRMTVDYVRFYQYPETK